MYVCIGSFAFSDPLISWLFIIHISPEKGIGARVCHRMPGCEFQESIIAIDNRYMLGGIRPIQTIHSQGLFIKGTTQVRNLH